MRMDGIQKEDIKAAVLGELCIGNSYMLMSGKTDETERMTLVDLSKRVAVFETKHGTKETYTYQELYNQIF